MRFGKTPGPTRSDANHPAARRFYEAMGSWPIEESATRWAPGNPALILLKPVGA
jgi:hypothetical protein